MTMDLYKKLCAWLLDWNTSDGGFGHCFLVLTWNLSCHAHNTANIWLCEIEWGSTFDAFEIYFAHMKMDQTGDKAKCSCHLYANPCGHLICPVLALAFYFFCCCNIPQNGQSQLFPGWDQYQRFSEMLSCLIWDHEAEVSELGVNPKMIGTHTIRKDPFLVVHQFCQYVFMLGGPWGLSRMSTCGICHQEISLLVAVWQCCHYCRWSLCLPPPPPPILFPCGMAGGKPTVPVLSSSLCLMMYHSFCILN